MVGLPVHFRTVQLGNYMAKSFRAQIADIDAKIAALQVTRAGLETKAAAEVDHAAVVEGRTITFNYGKGENVRTLTGLVLGRKDPEAGAKGAPLVKVAVGSGFDAQIVTIYPAQVTAIAAEAQAEAAAE